jgi:hypothetical protein
MQSGASRGSASSGALAFVMENGFEWPGLLSALVLHQHPDEHRPQHPVLLAVDQELGEGATLRVASELADPVRSLEVREHEDVDSSARAADVGVRRMCTRCSVVRVEGDEARTWARCFSPGSRRSLPVDAFLGTVVLEEKDHFVGRPLLGYLRIEIS